MDSKGITQYRIGTLTATSYQDSKSDFSIIPRIILSGERFGSLDGTTLGLSNAVVSNSSGVVISSSTGVKINLYDLMETSNPSINMTRYDGGTAEWTNIYNQYKSLYMSNNEDETFTDAEKAQKQQTVGTATIALASCYAGAKTKP